jgi:DNA-directed RNA polymerase specialized sigma24 family protein
MTGYRWGVTTEADKAAIAEARADALTAMERVAKAAQAADAARAQRDDAIRKMHDHGRSHPDIGRDLNLPVSTVRQSIKSAIVRSKTPS